MKKIVLAFLCFVFLLNSQTKEVFAQTDLTATDSASTSAFVVPPTDTTASYTRGKVVAIVDQQSSELDGQTFYTQRIQVERADTHQKVEIEVGSQFQPLNANQLLKVGTEVIISRQQIEPDRFEYVLVDVYRTPTMIWLAVGFFGLVIVVARRQGFLSIVGMVLSLLILSQFVVPQILGGANPIVVTMVGSFVIAVITVYLSHGWTVHSHLALLSMMVTLLAVSLLSSLAVHTGYLVGLGSEEAYFLQFGPTAHINLQGLLLGGIILGTLGILDDIVIAQISVVFQLKSANPKFTFHELYQRALVVGKDHVASLTNTLVLAYTAANLPLFLLFTINQNSPAWVTFNSEIIAEEVIRTLIGSLGLVLAVPFSTLCAVYVVEYLRLKPEQLHAQHGHQHHS